MLRKLLFCCCCCCCCNCWVVHGNTDYVPCLLDDKIVLRRFGTVLLQLLLLVIFQLRPVCGSAEATDPAVGQLALDALPPDDQHEKDKHSVQTVNGIDHNPEPGLRCNPFAYVEGKYLEYPEQPGQQEQLQVQHALVAQRLLPVRAHIVATRVQMDAGPDEQEDVDAQHHAQR
uniref:Putative secreted protein n=1 Tax=Anopheles triannulatus TaxID=58253 RepID=A0A2M4B0J1_9DIPT